LTPVESARPDLSGRGTAEGNRIQLGSSRLPIVIEDDEDDEEDEEDEEGEFRFTFSDDDEEEDYVGGGGK